MLTLLLFFSTSYGVDSKDESKEDSKNEKVIEIKYSSLEEIKKDGNNAIGFGISLKLKPVAISQDSVTFADVDGNYFKAFFPQTKRKIVRKLRRNAFHNVTLQVKNIRYNGDIVFEFINGTLVGGG